MSPSRTPRYALSDVTQQQNMAAPVLTNTAGGFDHSSMLVDETEAFALEPIDVTAIGEYIGCVLFQYTGNFPELPGLTPVLVRKRTANLVEVVATPITEMLQCDTPC